jgi:hypothetical protein
MVQDIGGLEVAVNDTDRVQVLEAFGNIQQHRHGVGLVHRCGLLR